MTLRRASNACSVAAVGGALLLWPVPFGMWSDGPGILLLFGGALAAFFLQVADALRRSGR